VISLGFDCLQVRPERYAATPTLAFRLQVTESTGAHIHTIALRCQIRIEPHQRRYTSKEVERLLELFGEPSRWGGTLKPIQLTTVTAMLKGFQGSAETDLLVPCPQDLELAGPKYFEALGDGEIPLLLLFSGTVFVKGPGGVRVEPVSWDSEARCRLPVRVWRETMDLYFPGTAWLRVRRETLDTLQRFKARRALPSWDDALVALLEGADEPAAGEAAR
jgi:Family of unknown function (DUF6084)